MEKSTLLELLNKIPDDYEVQFDVEIKEKEISNLKYDQYDINERAKKLYITLYK